MARLFFSGLETGHPASDGGFQGGAGGTLTFDGTVKRSGALSAKCDSGAGNGSPNFGLNSFTGATGRNYYLRGYFRFAAFPTATTTFMWFWNGAAGCCNARVTSTGKIQLWSINNGAQIGSDSTTTLSVDTWYRIELRVVVNTGSGDDTLELLLDGTTVATTTTGDAGTAAPQSANLGWCAAPGANKIVYVDDIALNDDQGTNQNGYPGEGKIVLLVPISDNARDTKWTGGAGGTTNLFDAVNNLPPAGLASASATNTSQIEHAGSAAGTTDRYDANMTTYTTAGLVSGDTIKVMQYLAVVGEDISTGAKLLTFEVLSNPAMTDGGAFTVGNGAIGTYPTNWNNYLNGGGAIVYNPTVTLGTSPVMRVRRPETASRVASCCFMGIYVEYVHFTGYTLDATGAQTYAETGTAATLRMARKLSAASGSYSMSGTAAGLKYGRKVGIAPGSYSESGQAVGLRVGRKLPIGSGSFAETGQDATLTHGIPGHILPVDPGSFSESGQAAGLKVGRKVTALSGTFTEVGSDVTLTWAQMRRLTAEAGAYSEVGSAAALTHGGVGYILTAEAVAYSESGQGVTLRLARKLVAAAGGFSEAGAPVALRAARRLSIEPGSFAESGSLVALAAGRKVAAGAASYSEVGQAASLRAGRRLIAESGSFIEVGASSTLAWSGESAPTEIAAKLIRPDLPQVTRAIT